MKRRAIQWFLSAFAFLAIGVFTSQSAMAAARSFPGAMALPVNAPAYGCYGYSNGWLTNSCGSEITVVLPVTVDNAAQYTLTVNGFSATGTLDQIQCRSTGQNALGHFFVVNPWFSIPGIGDPVLGCTNNQCTVQDPATVNVNAQGINVYLECRIPDGGSVISWNWF